jgi:hypothetical protein
MILLLQKHLISDGLIEETWFEVYGLFVSTIAD